jgi:hypothetical protein
MKVLVLFIALVAAMLAYGGYYALNTVNEKLGQKIENVLP